MSSLPEAMAEDGPEDGPEAMAEDKPEAVTEAMSEDKPEAMSENRSEAMSENRSAAIAERAEPRAQVNNLEVPTGKRRARKGRVRRRTKKNGKYLYETQELGFTHEGYAGCVGYVAQNCGGVVTGPAASNVSGSTSNGLCSSLNGSCSTLNTSGFISNASTSASNPSDMPPPGLFVDGTPPTVHFAGYSYKLQRSFPDGHLFACEFNVAMGFMATGCKATIKLCRGGRVMRDAMPHNHKRLAEPTAGGGVSLGEGFDRLRGERTSKRRVRSRSRRTWHEKFKMKVKEEDGGEVKEEGEDEIVNVKKVKIEVKEEVKEEVKVEVKEDAGEGIMEEVIEDSGEGIMEEVMVGVQEILEYVKEEAKEKDKSRLLVVALRTEYLSAYRDKTMDITR